MSRILKLVLLALALVVAMAPAALAQPGDACPPYGHSHGQGHEPGHSHGQGHDPGHSHGNRGQCEVDDDDCPPEGHSHGQGHDPGHSHGQGHNPGHSHGNSGHCPDDDDGGEGGGNGNGNGGGGGNGERGRGHRSVSAASATTPCSTIVITGAGYSPGSDVAIDRAFDGAGCGSAAAQAPSAQAASAQAPASSAQQLVVTEDATRVQVAEDGTFEAALTVPADQDMGTLDFTVSGVDAAGAAKLQTYVYEVFEVAEFTPTSVSEAVRPYAPTATTTAAGLLAVIVLGLLGNQFRLHRQRRR